MSDEAYSRDVELANILAIYTVYNIINIEYKVENDHDTNELEKNYIVVEFNNVCIDMMFAWANVLGVSEETIDKEFEKVATLDSDIVMQKYEILNDMNKFNFISYL